MHVRGTARDVEEAVASVAVEVVMMRQPRGFVARGLARNVDGCQLAFFHQGFKAPIHGGKTEGLPLLLG